LERSSVVRAIVRLSGAIVLTFTVAYLVLSVLPFYANGIYLHPYRDIAGSLVDVKGYPPFAWAGVGQLAQGIAMITAGLMPYASLLLTPLALMSLGLKRSSFARTEATLWVAAGLLNVVSLALTWQVHGTIMVWLVD
jgi:hypothetical protein